MAKESSKVIRISESTFIRLQAFATPLVDTPNDVISRLLTIVESNAENLKKMKET